MITDHSYKGVISLRGMYDNLSDERIAKALTRREVKDICKMVGIDLPYGYIKELVLVGMIREVFKGGADEVERIPCDCAGRGTRWIKADNYEPVLVYLSPALDTIFAGTVAIFRERFEYVGGLTERLSFEFVEDSSACDIVVDPMTAVESDGARGTLGFAQFYRDGTEDLDVYRDARWSVRIAMDFAERWTANFISTVGLHEVLHAVGLGHIEIPGNVLQSFYAGIQFELGIEELDALLNLYTDTNDDVPKANPGDLESLMDDDNASAIMDLGESA